MSYIGTGVSKNPPNYKLISEFTATAGQTVFAPSAYSAGYIDVFRNGVKLGAADFTATNGTTVTLTNACAAGDFVRFESVYINPIANAIPATAGAVSGTYLADAAVSQAKLATNVAGNGPAFFAYGNTNQTITTATFTKVVINTEVFDTNNNFDKDTNYRFQPTVAGYYQVNAIVEAYAGGTSIIACFGVLYKNGSEYIRGQGFDGSQVEAYSQISHLIYLNGTTDYIELYIYVRSSGSIILYGDSRYKTFSASLVRAA